MTIIIVGIVALPISVILSKHIQSVFISQDYTAALNLTRLEMEKVINTAYASIAIGTSTTSNYQGYAYNLTTAVSEITSGSQGYKLISISVTKVGSATVLASLKTYLTKNVIWGL